MKNNTVCIVWIPVGSGIKYSFGLSGIYLSKKELLKQWDEKYSTENEKEVLRYMLKKLNIDKMSKGSVVFDLNETIEHMISDRTKTKDIILYDSTNEIYLDDFELSTMDWKDTKLDLITNIKKYMESKGRKLLFLSQSTGTWRGNLLGGKILHIDECNFEGEILRMGDSIENICLKVDSNGEIVYDMYHHDGTNVRTFHLLNSKFEKMCLNEKSKYYYREIEDLFADTLHDMLYEKGTMKGLKWDDVVKPK